MDGQGGVVDNEGENPESRVQNPEQKGVIEGATLKEKPRSGEDRTAPSETVLAKDALINWRCFLFGIPESELAREQELARERAGGEAFIFRKRISREMALKVMAEGGRLKRSDYLRCRVRYFTDGAALGSKEFVEGVFQAAREQFSTDRKNGARPLRGIETVPKPERLYNLRQLQKNDVS